MASINPGQLRVKVNENGGVDVTYKNSSGTQKRTSSINNLVGKSDVEINKIIDDLMYDRSTRRGQPTSQNGSKKFNLDAGQQELIRSIAKGGNVAKGTQKVTQMSKPDADAYYPTETSFYDRNTGTITDQGKTRTIKPTTSDNFQDVPGGGSNSKPSTGFTLAGGNLSQGVSNNQSVRDIQRLLGIKVDGAYGPQTKSAVMRFQQDNGLVADGIVGPKTTQKINELLSSGSPLYSPSKVLGASAQDTGGTTSVDTTDTTGQTQNTYQQTVAIDEEANKQMNDSLQALLKSVGVKTSKSSKLEDAMLDLFDNNASPDRPDLEKTLADKRAELKVDAEEDELASIDAEIDKLDNDLVNLQQDEENRGVSTLTINRRKSQEYQNYERARNALNVKRNSVVRGLEQKYSVIDSLMKYTQQNYENARQDYNDNFTKATNFINILKDIDDTRKSDEEKAVDRASANVQIMMNMLKEKNLTYDKLDPKTRKDITNLELQARLPSGFVQFTLDAVDQPVVSMGSEFTDKAGNRQVPVYTKDPRTGAITTKLITIGQEEPKVSNDDKEEDIAAAILDFKDKMEQNGWRGISPAAYAYYKNEIKSNYGASAVLDFDKAIKSAGLQIDDKNFKAKGREV